MDRKIGIDLWIACICAAVIGIAWIYMDEGSERSWVLAAAGAVMLFFLLLAFLEKGMEKRRIRKHGTERGFALPAENGSITDLVLLSEEETELMVWDMYGKVSLVIGRDTGENQVDVDLSQSPYSGMVDVASIMGCNASTVLALAEESCINTMDVWYLTTSSITFATSSSGVYTWLVASPLTTFQS